MEFAGQLLCADVHHTDPVGGLVGILVIIVSFFLVENRIAVSIDLRRSFDRRAAQGDIRDFAVGTQVNAARPLAHRNRSRDLEVAAVDDRDVPRFFIGYVHLIRRGRQRPEQGAKSHRQTRQPVAGFYNFGNRFGFGYHEFMVAEPG